MMTKSRLYFKRKYKKASLRTIMAIKIIKARTLLRMEIMV